MKETWRYHQGYYLALVKSSHGSWKRKRLLGRGRRKSRARRTSYPCIWTKNGGMSDSVPGGLGCTIDSQLKILNQNLYLHKGANQVEDLAISRFVHLTPKLESTLSAL